MYYESCKILGVDPEATIEEIRKSFREKAKLLHPDVNKDNNANENFITLKKAYDYILKHHNLINYSKYTNYFENSKSNFSCSFNNFYTRRYYYYIHNQKNHNKKNNNENVEKKLAFLNVLTYIIFIFIGLIMIISPTYSTIINGIEKNDNLILKIFVVFIFTIFGLITTIFLFHNFLKYCSENNIKIKNFYHG